MEPITIRTATEQDIPLINELGEQSFYPTYLPFISAEQVSYMFHMMYDAAALRKQMRERGDIFFIAYAGTQALGFASCQHRAEGVTKLHKLYVLPELQVKGVGKALLDRVEQAAGEAGQGQVLLNVNRENKAIGFYRKCGYAIRAADDIDIGNGFFMNDYEMIKSLY
ncbi:MAG: GNAT family N-acetyltransferase [Chitinophagaceae bacterium]|nr:GNAT family N-acetyltransferase [Chitinophagaceae bacterium]